MADCAALIRPAVLFLTQRHLEAAPGAGAGHHCFVPALDIRVVGEIYLMPFVPPGPAKDREIGDRDLVAAGIPRFRQTLVDHAVEPPRLLGIAFETVAPVLLLLDLQEMM